MKMLTEYLERAVEFEKLAVTEQNGAFKAELLKQASAYRQRCVRRNMVCRNQALQKSSETTYAGAH
jgi:hypothetical protein